MRQVIQRWWCERCHQHGSIRYNEWDGPHFRQCIEDSHALTTSWCAEMWGMLYVRVVP